MSRDKSQLEMIIMQFWWVKSAYSTVLGPEKDLSPLLFKFAGGTIKRIWLAVPVCLWTGKFTPLLSLKLVQNST